MSRVNAKIVREIERIVVNSSAKREILLQRALSKSIIKKRLTIYSGILALFSAGAITTVIVKFFGNEILQIIAAISAAISGSLSIIITIYYAEEDTSKMFEGSSKYLSLKDKAYRILINPNSSNEQTYNDLANLQIEYAQLDESFSKYTRYKKLIASKQSYIGSQIPPPRIKTKKELIVQKAYDNEMAIFKKEVALLRKDDI